MVIAQTGAQLHQKMKGGWNKVMLCPQYCLQFIEMIWQKKLKLIN